MQHPILKIVFNILILSSIACVPTKKYAELENRANVSADENRQLHTAMEENEILKQDLLVAERDLRASYMQNEILTISNKRLRQDFEDLSKRYEQSLDENNAIVKANSFAKMELDKQMEQLEMNSNMYAYSSLREKGYEEDEFVLDSLADLIDQQAYELKLLHEKVYFLEHQLDEIEDNLAASFEQYQAGQYNLKRKDNKLYLSLSHDLLFKKGSSRLDKKGIEALTLFTNNFKDLGQIEFVVEGHTDSDGSEHKNWDLSTKRAIHVAQQLIKLGLDPKTITAAGRSYYDPVVTNTTEANKAKNRRTEIIIIPKS